MTKFDDEYPDASPPEDSRLHPQVGEVWICESAKPCVTCGQPTRWIEVCAESFVCSVECSKTLWADYAKALRAKDQSEDCSESEMGFCHELGAD